MDSDGSLSPSQAALQMAEFTLPPSSVEAGSPKASKIGEDILYPLENCIKNMSPPKNGTISKGHLIFQPLVFRGHASFRGNNFLYSCFLVAI